MSNEEIRNIILLSCNSLNDHDFEGFLNLCVKDFKYSIKVFSPELLKDMVWLEHDYEGPDDMPAHVRTALTAVNLSIPITQSRLALGTWQGVYLWEHRHHDHHRKVTVHLLGE